MLQHGSYTLLIDACYDREQFPTLDEAIEWTWASTIEEIEAVTFVLRKFFVLENDVYVQKRIQEELSEYHSKAETNQRIAIDRETKRKENNTNRAKDETKRKQDVNEAPPNHKPLTNNQEPHTKARVCVAIKRIYDAANKSITDMNPDNPILIALIEAGATVGEFTYAAQSCVDAGKGFGYLLGIVKKQREEALKLKIHKGVMPASTSREAGRNIAAKSIFTIENTRHLQGVKSNFLEKENEIKSIAN